MSETILENEMKNEWKAYKNMTSFVAFLQMN